MYRKPEAGSLWGGPPMRRLLILVLLLFGLSCGELRAQSTNASVTGYITDPTKAVIVGAKVIVINVDTNVRYEGTTNNVGSYDITNLPPGPYRIEVEKPGFKTVVKSDLILHIQDTAAINFEMALGSVSEIVTVQAGGLIMNTTDGSVSTVIDRNFVQSLPLNGRSFNTLLQLTPGVVIAQNTSGATGQGQFSIAGQRVDANNFTIDGVSANFGVGSGVNLSQSGTGGAQAFSVLGSTSSLVSVDDLEEFRIETSSYAPEFGKTPGGQVILTTRSGTNDFHGGAFDYFRNTVMDANDWFAKQAGLPRAPEHHNDFGGFLGGPIWKDKTFFFFSYEGARLRLPQTQEIQVPYLNGTSCAASAAIAPFLNAFPKPNGAVSTATCTGELTGSLSNPATLNATSIRVDHNFSERFSIFGRYNDAPSHGVTPFGPSTSLSSPSTVNVDTKTLTVGLNMLLSSKVSNIIRGNYSSQANSTSSVLDSFGGAVPISSSLLLGSVASPDNLGFFSIGPTSYSVGNQGKSSTRQVDFTDALTISANTHQFKFGGDYRAIFLDENQAQSELFYLGTSAQTLLSTGSLNLSSLTAHPAYFLAQSLSLYAQDTWKVTPRLTMTYGVVWELSPAPSARGNTTLASFKNINNPATITLVPSGAPLWSTTYRNFAPRFGAAYRLTPSGNFVLRAGVGVFYDLGVGQSANLGFNVPNSAFAFASGVPVPIADVTPFLPAISLLPPYSFPIGFDPHLELPRSYQWSVALERSLGDKQVFTATYVGQAGRDLLRQEALFQPNPNFVGDILLTLNDARSNYNALQLQFRRPLASHLQALLNYSWSHSLDNASDDVIIGLPANVISAANDYASSDFDVRQSFSGALSYDIPAAGKSGLVSLLTRNWSLQTVVVARTGFPFNAKVFSTSPDPEGEAAARPDLVPGQPFWISNQMAGGGKSLNPAAFAIPSTIRQGTEGRNDIPGFGLTQIDASIGRMFPITERVKIQFRADAFNLFNHPNFTNPSGFIEFGPSFLQSNSMLNTGLAGMSPLFQQGGPRSLQLSLKMTF
jgi:hypothetical protein